MAKKNSVKRAKAVGSLDVRRRQEQVHIEQERKSRRPSFPPPAPAPATDSSPK